MPGYDDFVFINCPFDDRYQELFRAIVFAVVDCGFSPRCALERSDSGETRIDKLFRIISECRYGIHDISATELDPVNRLPRFNMPLELGIFLGATRYGTTKQRRKSCLILDREQYRYQKFCSDIAGQDPKTHEGEPMARIKGAPAVVANRVGDGVIVRMVDDPNFRGFWLGTHKLVMNALFFGGVIDETPEP